MMLEKYEICCGILHGFDWSKWVDGHCRGAAGLLPPPGAYPHAGGRQEPAAQGGQGPVEGVCAGGAA